MDSGAVCGGRRFWIHKDGLVEKEKLISPASVVEVFMAVEMTLDSDGGEAFVNSLFQGATLDDDRTFLEYFYQ